MENKEKYRKLSLKDADLKPDVQTRTHLTTCNNAKGRKNSQSLQGNAKQKGSKCQEVIQGHEWTRTW